MGLGGVWACGGVGVQIWGAGRGNSSYIACVDVWSLYTLVPLLPAVHNYVVCITSLVT